MYIGTSLGRCLPSILRGEVQLSEVGVIITRTMTSTLEQFLEVVHEYYHYGSKSDKRYDYSGLELKDVEAIAITLWETGRIHQPRNFNAYNTGHVIPEMSRTLWMEVVPVNTSTNESVVQAYEHYKMLSALVK